MLTHALVRTPLVLVLCAAALAGCGDASSPGAAPAPSSTQASEPAKTTSPRPTTAAAPSPAPKAAEAAKPAEGAPDLVAILGTKKEGWSPKVITALKRGMKPDEAAKVLPGADNVSKFGFARVPVKGVPGLAEYELYYAKDKSGQPTELQSVKLVFDSALNEPAFYDSLVKATSDKYGKPKPEEIEKQLITWAGPKSGMAQLTKGLTEHDGYELRVTLQR